MTLAKSDRIRRLFFVTLLASLAVGICASDSYAQRAGKRGRSRRPSSDRKPPQRNDGPTVAAPGRTEGTIVKFSPASADDLKEDEKLIGELKVKPLEKGARTLILIVRDLEDLKIKVGDHEFERDEMTFYFQKGLHVEADWGYLDPDSKRKIKKKVLRGLTFQTTEILAKVEAVKDVGVEVRGVPLNNQQWPGYHPPERNNRPGTAEEERVIKRSLRLKFIEDVTLVRNEENEEADMGDFKEGDEVRVTAVFAGTKIGMLIALRPPNVADVSAPSKPDKDDDERKPPPPGPRNRGRSRAPQG